MKIIFSLLIVICLLNISFQLTTQKLKFHHRNHHRKSHDDNQVTESKLEQSESNLDKQKASLVKVEAQLNTQVQAAKSQESQLIDLKEELDSAQKQILNLESVITQQKEDKTLKKRNISNVPDSEKQEAQKDYNDASSLVQQNIDDLKVYENKRDQIQVEYQKEEKKGEDSLRSKKEAQEQVIEIKNEVQLAQKERDQIAQQLKKRYVQEDLLKEQDRQKEEEEARQAAEEENEKRLKEDRAQQQLFKDQLAKEQEKLKEVQSQSEGSGPAESEAQVKKIKKEIADTKESQQFAQAKLKQDKAKQALVEKAIEKGWKLTGTQDCVEVDADMKKELAKIDPDSEVGKAVAANENAQVIMADSLGDNGEERIQRGEKFEILFKVQEDEKDHWTLSNISQLTGQYKQDIELIDTTCSKKPDGYRHCLFRASLGTPPDPTRKEERVPLEWVKLNPERMTKTININVWQEPQVVDEDGTVTKVQECDDFSGRRRRRFRKMRFTLRRKHRNSQRH